MFIKTLIAIYTLSTQRKLLQEKHNIFYVVTFCLRNKNKCSFSTTSLAYQTITSHLCNTTVNISYVQKSNICVWGILIIGSCQKPIWKQYTEEIVLNKQYSIVYFKHFLFYMSFSTSLN